jgi:hypothetical protein
MKREITIIVLTTLASVTFAAGPRYSNWSEPVNLGPAINTDYNDQHPALSKDGLSLYLTSDRPGGFGNYDLWVSQRTSVDEPWGTPQNLGPIVNTSASDFAPALSRDGHWLFFSSDRPGGFGGHDVLACYREHVHDDFDWQTPINLGPGVNSLYDDSGPILLQDDQIGAVTLYFNSNRPGVAGAADIFAAVMNPDGSFGPSAPVPELNSSGRDTRMAIRHDGLEIIFQSDRTGSVGSGDLWVSTRATTLDPWSTPVNVGPPVNTIYFDGAPALSADGETLLFYSNRPGGFGANDIYLSTRHKLRDQDERGPETVRTE